MPRTFVGAPPPGSWRRRPGEPRRWVGDAPGRQPGRVQTVERGRNRRLFAHERMAGQGRRVRDPGAGGGGDPLGQRVLFESRRVAALRDRPAARRPRLSTELARELLISAGPGEWRAALLEEGVPVELYVERGDRSEAGSIHLGRVARLLPALGATLFDIGGDRPAFLPQSEVL